MSTQIIRDWSRAQVHFVGIGGSGMSGIARIMASRGAQVSGSDLNDSSTLNGLRSLGAKIYIGHSLDNLGSPDLVIKSSAIASSFSISSARFPHLPYCSNTAGVRVYGSARPRCGGTAFFRYR